MLPGSAVSRLLRPRNTTYMSHSLVLKCARCHKSLNIQARAGTAGNETIISSWISATIGCTQITRCTINDSIQVWLTHTFHLTIIGATRERVILGTGIIWSCSHLTSCSVLFRKIHNGVVVFQVAASLHACMYAHTSCLARSTYSVFCRVCVNSSLVHKHTLGMSPCWLGLAMAMAPAVISGPSTQTNITCLTHTQTCTRTISSAGQINFHRGREPKSLEYRHWQVIQLLPLSVDKSGLEYMRSFPMV